MKNASFETLLDDVKISYRFALKNAISYVLATIGVLIVTVLLLAVVAALIFVPLVFLSGGFEAFVTWVSSFSHSDAMVGTTVAAGAVLIFSPLLAPFFVAIGALFGMGREIVESEGTTAEGVFAWYKRKFFSLAGGGVVLFLIVMGPMLLLLLVGTVVYGDQFLMTTMLSTGQGNPVIASLMMVWFVISTGSLSMMFPAIIDGHSVLESVTLSFRMSYRYF
ncbi:MAG: hypothetical protein ACP6KW_12500, partial [Candidatus Thorarchaeota archaeon]